MVNTGKASNACAICKQRRIKCDLVTPACSQCIKSGWTCPGPKTAAELKFKDQTDIIVARNSSHGTLSSRQVADVASQSDAPSYSLVRSLSPSIHDRGMAFFMHHYVLRRPPNANLSATWGHYEYLPALVQSEKAVGPLRMIVAAAGLAALSNAGNSTSFAAESFRLYNEAIRRLQLALNNPDEACSDSTLAAIMLMSTFEAIASGDLESMKSYEKHIMAAAQCIDLRGPTQFGDRSSLKLFLEVRRVILTTCHQLQITVPYAMDQWSEWAEQAQYPDERCANRFAERNSQIAAFRASIKRREVTDSSEITAQLLAMDKQLLDWKSGLPKSWHYAACQTSISGSSPLCLWRSRHDTYTDFWKAVAVWNSYRCVRLLIHEAILNANLMIESAGRKDILQASAAVLREMTDEVCLSVPFVLGYCPSDRHQAESAFQPEAGSPPIPGGFLLIWPLFLSAISRTTPSEQRDWIKDILDHIGSTMGLRLAISMSTVLANKNKTRSDGESWLNGDFYP